MPSGDVRSDIGHWKPRLTRAALWGLLGGLSFLLGWWALAWIELPSLHAIWVFGPIEIESPELVIGLIFSGVLGVVSWRSGRVGWRRAAGFALLAVPWFVSGGNIGNLAFGFFGDCFLAWLLGSLAAGLWLALAGILLLPVLRARGAVAWLLAASSALSLPIATMHLDVTEWDFCMRYDFHFLAAAWCAAFAAAFSMAIPPTDLSTR